MRVRLSEWVQGMILNKPCCSVLWSVLSLVPLDFATFLAGLAWSAPCNLKSRVI